MCRAALHPEAGDGWWINRELTSEDMGQCVCCEQEKELRMGYCYDCIEAQEIIHNGLDMFDKGPEGDDKPALSAIEKVRFLLKKGWRKG